MTRVFTAGSWDIFHFGHIELLRRSKELGDYLIVGVSTDELIEGAKGLKPIIPYNERLEIVKHCDYVDEVVCQKTLIDVQQFLELKCDLFTVGNDWESRNDNDGLNWLRERGKVVFLPYTKHLSSSEIKRRIIQNAYAIIEQQVKKQ